MDQINRFNEINNYLYDKGEQEHTIKDDELKVEATKILATSAIKANLSKENLENIALFAGMVDKNSENALIEKAKALTVENEQIEAENFLKR